MKKIGKILGMIGSAFIIVIVIGAFFGLFDDEVADLTNGELADNRRTMVETEDGIYKEIQTKEEAEEPAEAQISATDDEHYYVGDSIEYTNGMVITITGAGITDSVVGDPLVFVDMELENTADSVTNLSNDNFYMYIDDYQADVAFEMIDTSEHSSYIDVNPGRKAKFTFRSQLPNDYKSSNKIEIEFPGDTKTILIKDNGVYLNGIRPEDYVDNSLDESLYGNYAYMGGEDFVLMLMPYDNDKVSAAVSIKEDSATYHQYLLYLEDEAGGYLTLITGSKVGSLYFREDGIEVNLDNADRYSGLYAYNQQDMSSAETINIPEYEFADDDPYNPNNLYGEYTQVDNPNITLSVDEMTPGTGLIRFVVDFGDDRNTFVTYQGDSGLLIDYFTDEDAGYFDISREGITFTDCSESDANGTYQKSSLGNSLNEE